MDNNNLEYTIDELKNTFSQRLKYLRAKHRMTQESLAYCLDMSRTHIASLESATSLPSLKVILKIVNYFNCSFDFLLNKNITADQYASSTSNIFEILKYADEVHFDDMEVTEKERDLIISAIKHALSIVKLSEEHKK